MTVSLGGPVLLAAGLRALALHPRHGASCLSSSFSATLTTPSNITGGSKEEERGWERRGVWGTARSLCWVACWLGSAGPSLHPPGHSAEQRAAVLPTQCPRALALVTAPQFSLGESPPLLSIHVVARGSPEVNRGPKLGHRGSLPGILPGHGALGWVFWQGWLM